MSLDADDDAAAFQNIMFVATYESWHLPPSFSLGEVQKLADMCAKYDLRYFFRQHSEARKKIVECAR